MDEIYLHAWNILVQDDRKNLDKMRTYFGNYKNAWNRANAGELLRFFSPEKISHYLEKKKELDPDRLYKKINKKFRLIMCIDADYPPLLKHIKHYPAGIYTRGKINLSRHFLSIVGTRKNTRYGELQIKKLVQNLKNYPFTIVSGLAHGIDTIAHWSAIQENLQTIAVLGYGFDYLPRTKFKLVREILEKDGALISEYPPEREGTKYTFPERNRIIAGISPVTIVAEAPEKSGALITANLAFESDRTVFAIPGDIDRIESRGCNEIIRGNQASPLLDPINIFEEDEKKPQN